MKGNSPMTQRNVQNETVRDGKENRINASGKKLEMEMKLENKKNSYNQIALTTEATGGDASP